eukprot:EG_transcript_45361
MRGQRMEPVFHIEDVVGSPPSPEALPDLKAALAELTGKVGWAAVKRSVAELLEVVQENYQRELRGEKLLDICLNRLLLGNPGTGKTTCAKLYGRILKALGLLSKADVELKVASDFVGDAVGQSQTKTAAILELCRGKVLV